MTMIFPSCIEGEEEIGIPLLPQFLSQNKEKVVALVVVGTKGVDKAVKLTKDVKVVEGAGGVRVIDSIDAMIKNKLFPDLRTVINDHGHWYTENL
ncbi:hypothetical protein [Neobacillus niacini]|uniref:hypothetical protein n=1 Tax=Neobacillus niacini TaxID=86668 RepID=UPI002FFE8559